MTVRTKQDAAKVLADAMDDKRFFCHDGCVAKNLYQLADCLSRITEESFTHHANEAKNDFANWIRDVLGDSKLASDLARVSDQVEAAGVVKERISWLQKKMK